MRCMEYWPEGRVFSEFMKRFTRLFQEVDATTSTNEKVSALTAYFNEAHPADQIWALYLLLGKTRKTYSYIADAAGCVSADFRYS